METLEFSTPKRARPKSKPSVPVHLCGQDMMFHEPKQAVKFFASEMIGTEVSEADMAMALLQFINGCLDPADQKVFTDRVADRGDRLGRVATEELVGRLMDRWSDDPSEVTQGTMTLDGPDDGPTFYGDAPIRVLDETMRVDVVASPPKDLALQLSASGMATGASVGQLAWSVGFFLDACCEPGDRLLLGRRMNNRADREFDLPEAAEIVTRLLQRWAPDYAPEANRAARRAAKTRK